MTICEMFEANNVFLSGISDKLSGITCISTNTTLNITWQTIKRNIFSTRMQGFTVRISRNHQHIKPPEDLNSSINHYFLSCLGKHVYLHFITFKSVIHPN